MGVTHFCVLLANYYSSVCREKTALLEWNSHFDFTRIETLCIKKKSIKKSFEIYDIDFYKDADAQILLYCMDQHYDKVIIDFGVINKQIEIEFLRCSSKYLIGSLSEWQFYAFWDFVREHQLMKESWKYLFTFGSEETRRELERKIKMPLIRIPFSVDAFTIHYKLMLWFQQLLD